jgi:hypothetical protein
MGGRKRSGASVVEPESNYFKHAADRATILVGWEHAHIEQAVKFLFETMYQDPDAAKQVPAWSFEDYDLNAHGRAR